MRRDRLFVIAAIAALLVCTLPMAGCGDGDDETTTTTTTSSAASAIDAAVQSCSDQAQQLGGAAGTALTSACTSVGDSAEQALSTGGEQAEQALSQAASSCESKVGTLPAGQAQDALSSLCNAIKSAG